VESPGITTGGVTEGKLYDDISPVQTIPMSGGDGEHFTFFANSSENLRTYPRGRFQDDLMALWP
jgi:hypothetical protein